MQPAFTLDALRGSHPIEVPVRDALDIDQIFDHISYLKGSSVIRMLSAHLGVEVFLKGVSDYLKAHMYGESWSSRDAQDCPKNFCKATRPQRTSGTRLAKPPDKTSQVSW